MENVFAEVLAELVGRERVSVTSDFFADLGANSLVMAQFCARLRKRDDVPSVSMKDIYSHPTIQRLTTALAEVAEPVADPEPVDRGPVPAPTRASTRRYVACAVVQLLVFLGYGAIATPVFVVGWKWMFAAPDLLMLYVRTVAWAAGAFVLLTALPIVAKWALVGRWRPEEFPVWGARYLRLWVVKILMRLSPMVFLVGNPLYVLYLRALGAHIGKGVTILSRNPPVCTDLLTIGAGTVIRKDAFFQCYRAQDGRIQTGPVTLGRDAFVGEGAVLDLDTSLGDGSQLGHTSALHSGQRVPSGERWHGSPARPTTVDYLTLPAMRCGTVRRTAYGLSALFQALFVAAPVSMAVVYLISNRAPALAVALGMTSRSITSAATLRDALLISTVTYVAFAVGGLLVLYTVPRALSLLIQPGKLYRLYGIRYSTHRLISRMTNVKFFKWLLGDSSYIVPYLRGLGYDLAPVEQTGANFGAVVAHETPYLVTVGTGTMVADGLSVINAEFSATSFRVTRAAIGPRNFIGNVVAYPSGGRTGANCLLATKVMVPLDGPVREGVGLLGSPPFEIPRSVERDTRFDHLRTGEQFRTALRAKNRYNLRTVGFYLLVRWVEIFALMLLALFDLNLGGLAGWLMIAAYPVMTMAFMVGFSTFVERAVLRTGRMSPQLCSIYDPYMWWHERFWKLPAAHLAFLNGTPYKNLAWRLRGARLGRQVFDDGGFLTEPMLTSVGDCCTFNMGSVVQCHSQEDGTFKSDRTTLGSGCTLGVHALVHYGVTIGDGADIAADSFLMKGEEVPSRASWGGNPATESRRPQLSRTGPGAGRLAVAEHLRGLGRS